MRWHAANAALLCVALVLLGCGSSNDTGRPPAGSAPADSSPEGAAVSFWEALRAREPDRVVELLTARARGPLDLEATHKQVREGSVAGPPRPCRWFSTRSGRTTA